MKQEGEDVESSDDSDYPQETPKDENLDDLTAEEREEAMTMQVYEKLMSIRTKFKNKIDELKIKEEGTTQTKQQIQNNYRAIFKEMKKVTSQMRTELKANIKKRIG